MMEEPTPGLQKLQEDLEILKTMAAQMAAYLPSDVLFWPLHSVTMPRLTLGGYLMRQHRLVALFNLLTQEQQNQLQAAMTEYHTALEDRTVIFEQKAHKELDSRLRQWSEHLRDMRADRGRAVNYATAAEIRVMIEVMMQQLQKFPYQLSSEYVYRLKNVDSGLLARWRKGPFVWPEEWQSAYPQTEFWWLYGEPK
ncbi:MAG: hypothetical protein KDE59_00125 [Anaerolineales bacterium]|nr:hypothetical protein [Anaerolineales bacterium]MCB0014342.1 hypothetical protein [Anaerolineales bacterium]MCB0028638.1 hypothetical protein [Anaerolineales bacterium]MCB8960720.1 hypothetical protein [Ardenticatenales bacterium]